MPLGQVDGDDKQKNIFLKLLQVSDVGTMKVF